MPPESALVAVFKTRGGVFVESALKWACLKKEPPGSLALYPFVNDAWVCAASRHIRFKSGYTLEFLVPPLSPLFQIPSELLLQDGSGELHTEWGLYLAPDP